LDLLPIQEDEEENLVQESGWINIKEERNPKTKAMIFLKEALDKVNVDLYTRKASGGYKLETYTISIFKLEN